MSLRETKKAATRTAIADAALRLFLARGFDRVTVAEVADAAGVSVNTAFNYFPTKEDLFFDRQDEVVGRLAGAVAGRRAGEDAVAAVRRLLLAEVDEGAATLGLGAGAEAFWRVVEQSPALRARLLSLREQSEAALADALAEAADAAADDARPRLAAAILAGLDAAVHAEIRRRTHDDAEVRALVEEACALAGQGLGGYPG